jgi:apolipoprotein N-acyltransferase
MGHTQHTMLSLIQIADLGGVYLVSFLVVAVNAWVFELLYQAPRFRDLLRLEEPGPARSSAFADSGGRTWLGVFYQAGVLLIAIILTGIYGTWRLEQNRFEQGPLLALLQTNLSQELREQKESLAERINHLAALNNKAMAHFPVPDLIVWPETSYEGDWYESSSRLPFENIPAGWREREVSMRQHLSRELVKFFPTNHLLGVHAYNLGEDLKKITPFNTALFVNKHGGTRGRYDKVHRVPFGEYVPLRGWVPFIEWIAPYDYDYSIEQGTKFTRFELDKHKFGVLICYEDTDPVLARHYVRAHDDGPAVDFLVNMSNDGWFGGSSEHDEHLAISRFRAIECRRALARSVNMGISAVIDGNGRILRPTELPPPGEPHTWKITDAEELPVAEWSAFKDSAGVILAWIPLDRRASWYAANGDWFAGTCLGLVLAAALWSIVHHYRLRRAAKNV